MQAFVEADRKITRIAEKAYKEKNMYGKKVMGVLRTTYLIDEEGMIIYACDKVKAKEDATKMLEIIS